MQAGWLKDKQRNCLVLRKRVTGCFIFGIDAELRIWMRVLEIIRESLDMSHPPLQSPPTLREARKFSDQSPQWRKYEER